jgi:uncharacterized protein DUF1587
VTYVYPMKLGLIVPAGMAFTVLACGGRTSGIAAGASGSSVGAAFDASSGAAVSTGNGSTGSGPTAGLDAGLTDVSFTLVQDDGSLGDGAVVAQPVTHLTATEYANTVNDLLSVPPSAQSIPLGGDSTAGWFTIGGPVSDTNVQAYHDSAVAIASQVVSNLGNLLAPVNCDTTTGAACAASFINAFAPLAFRHGVVDPATMAGLNQTFGRTRLPECQPSPRPRPV